VAPLSEDPELEDLVLEGQEWGDLELEDLEVIRREGPEEDVLVADIRAEDILAVVDTASRS
jgi:hypothetical protein